MLGSACAGEGSEGSIRTGTNTAGGPAADADGGELIEISGILPLRASRSQVYNSDRHTPLRSATAAIDAPGASASSMIRNFSAVGQFRRRSIVEMISAVMCLTVLNHVRKDTKPLDPNRARNPPQPQSSGHAYPISAMMASSPS